MTPPLEGIPPHEHEWQDAPAPFTGQICVLCVLYERADLVPLLQRVQDWPHTKVNGACVQSCYGCERSGLQARIKFTEDYESLRTEIAALRAERVAAQDENARLTSSNHVLRREVIKHMHRAEAAEAERDRLHESIASLEQARVEEVRHTDYWGGIAKEQAARLTALREKVQEYLEAESAVTLSTTVDRLSEMSEEVLGVKCAPTSEEEAGKIYTRKWEARAKLRAALAETGAG